jgi:hypothetical protein
VLAAPLLAKWLFGWLVGDVDAPVRAGDDDVQSTVFAPASARPSTAFLVQVFVHPAADADAARALATEFDVAATRRAYRTLGARLRRGCTIDVQLHMPGLELDDPVGSLVWNGRAEAVQFGVRVPAGADPGTVLGTVALACDSVPLGRITFRLEVAQDTAPAAPEPQGETAHRYQFAFISYSSEDRQQVVERVQALSAVDLDFFQDFWSMRAGTEWVPAIAAALDRCDLFLLFWSGNAKRSVEVRKEVARALARQSSSEHALPDIRPVILEGPPVVEPWEELRHLQFNDPLVYLLPRRR